MKIRTGHFMRYLGQALLYALFVTVVGYFSVAPAYVRFPPDQALLMVSFSHAGQLKQDCRRRTDEELTRLAPNMRAPLECQRERSPVMLVLDLDGRALYQAILAPAGLSRDGVSTVYQRFAISAGRHRLRARLKDDMKATTGASSIQVDDFNYSREGQIVLTPGQIFVVEFDAHRGGFIFK